MLQLVPSLVLAALLAVAGHCTPPSLPVLSPLQEPAAATDAPSPSRPNTPNDLAEFRCTAKSCGGKYNPELYRQV